MRPLLGRPCASMERESQAWEEKEEEREGKRNGRMERVESELLEWTSSCLRPSTSMR